MNPFANFYYQDIDKFINNIIPEGYQKFDSRFDSKPTHRYDYIVLVNSLATVSDIQEYIGSFKKYCYSHTKIIVIYYNFLWKPVLDLATILKFRKETPVEPSWLSQDDISNIFNLTGFVEVSRKKRILLPLNLGFVSKFINNFFGQLPLINNFCLTTCQVFRVTPPKKEYSVSIIIPARNEEGNIKGIFKKIPRMSKNQEVIFVEGNSKDDTFKAIGEEIKKTKNIKAFLYKQKGKGKGDAVRLGFSKAKNDILIILDADLTVDPKDLPKFYKVLSSGIGDFANGSRLIYPMEKQAMRTLNYLANKIFGVMFSYLLDQKIKDTLCGTKAIFREGYLKIQKNRKVFGDFDPFGDFDLLFGSAKLNLKIVEVPIRYKERTYGKTNISRFRHGWLLLGMTFFAAKKIKFI